MWAEKEDPEPFFSSLKKFRQILDSDEPEEKKAKTVLRNPPSVMI